MKDILGNPSRRVLDRRVYNRLQFGSALGLGVGFLLLFFIVTGILGAKPSRLSDFFYQPPLPSGQVIIVALDDASVKAIGALPWSRATLAKLIDALAQARPRVIGLDLVLADASTDDALLAQALARAPQIVQPVVGINVTRLPARSNALPQFGFAIQPISVLQTHNTHLGHSNIEPDDDHIVRRVPLLIESNGKHYPAFGLAALEAYHNQSIRPDIATGVVWLGEQRLPVDDQGQIDLNFFSPALQQTLSAVDVLNGRADLSPLRDKIVLIGITGSAHHERFETPISNEASVAPIHLQADLIETVLSHRTLAKQDRLTEIVLVFLVALTAGATLPHVRFLSALALTIIYFLFYVGYAFTKFNGGVIVQPLYPTLALILMLCGTMLYRYFSEERRRTFITQLLRRYLAPEAVDAVAQDFALNRLPMHGVHRELSVLAIDLSELEPLAGSLTAEALVTLLNKYVSMLVGIVFRHQGSVVKQTGSAILAAWNLLIDQPVHVQTAVRAAIEMRHAITEFNRRQPKELTIRVGMGVATGSVIAGRIGASPRAEYAIIGEIVGMAERIALKPERGVFIDVTTRERLGEEFDMLEVKPVRLRRKTDPSHVWLLVEATETQEEINPAPAERIAAAK